MLLPLHPRSLLNQRNKSIRFVLHGTIHRHNLHNLIQWCGGRVARNVSSVTNFLVYEHTSDEIKRVITAGAAENTPGCKCISISELIDMVHCRSKQIHAFFTHARRDPRIYCSPHPHSNARRSERHGCTPAAPCLWDCKPTVAECSKTPHYGQCCGGHIRDEQIQLPGPMPGGPD